ncbi:MAG: hypothetical protein ACPLY9_04420 [Nitrososphaerales archaeon]
MNQRVYIDLIDKNTMDKKEELANYQRGESETIMDTSTMKDKTKILALSEKLELCENIGDIFELVKETTDRSIGQRRAGLTLYISDLPPYIGAMHQIGSNAIIMNRFVLDALKTSDKLRKDANPLIYVILLHEYLHALGYAEEADVRTIAYKIATNSFGENHKTTEFLKKGLSTILPQILEVTEKRSKIPYLEIVKDFDRSSMPYIA